MSYEIFVIISFLNAYEFINKSFQNSKDIIKKGNIQIIYIDNNSKVGPVAILKRKISNIKIISLLKTKKSMGSGPGIDKNLGTKFAKGKKIL